MTDLQGEPGIHERRFRMPRTVIALMLREMSTTYGRTPGGYLWAIIEPIAAIAVLTAIMIVGLRIRHPALGTNFPLFFATGMLPFNLFNRTAGRTSGSLSFSRPLLFYPGVTFMDAIIARTLLSTLTQLLVFYIVVAGLMWLYDTGTILSFGPIAMSLTMAVCVGLGIGTLNCYLFSAFPVWAKIWSIVTAPLMILSCVIFLYDSLPENGRNILWYNPLVHVVGEMRRGFYPTYEAAYVSPVYVFAIAASTFTLGLLLLFRFHKDILNG